MLERIEGSDTGVAKFFASDVGKCLYSAIDLDLYGLDGEEFTVYAERNDDGALGAVFAVFGDCGHLYSLPGFPVNGGLLLNVANDLNLRRIDGCAYVIDAIRDNFTVGWTRNDGAVAKCDAEVYARLHLEVPDQVNMLHTVCAKSDVEFDAAGMFLSRRYTGCVDAGLRYAEKEKDKNARGEGRTFYLTNGAEVIGYAGTSEYRRELAVVNGVYIDPNYRRRGLAKRLVYDVCGLLINEKMDVYLYYFDMSLESLYSELGFSQFEVWSKLERD